jgi:hypothetical protein
VHQVQLDSQVELGQLEQVLQVPLAHKVLQDLQVQLDLD